MAERKVKVRDGIVKYLYTAADGSFVEGAKQIELLQDAINKAEVDASIPGFDLKSGDYYFETETVSVKLKKSAKDEEEG